VSVILRDGHSEKSWGLLVGAIAFHRRVHLSSREPGASFPTRISRLAIVTRARALVIGSVSALTAILVGNVYERLSLETDNVSL